VKKCAKSAGCDFASHSAGGVSYFALMLNYIWLGLILAAVLLGGHTGKMKELTDGAFDSAKTAVTIAIGLIGIMSLWLGIMRLAERSGLVRAIARGLRPLTVRLFPDVPHEHPAIGSIVMTIAANMLGLSNAATPLGLRAMGQLESLNPRPGTATNAMCTFLAISTSSVQLIPATAIAILASAGSKNPTSIIGTALLATTCAAMAGVISVKFLEKLPVFKLPQPGGESQPAARGGTQAGEPPPALETLHPAPLERWGTALLLLFLAGFAWLGYDAFARTGPDGNPFIRAVNAISLLAIPFLLSFFPLYAALRRVKVYEEFVEGAKEGFQVAVRIIPYLVAILVAVGMFRAVGGIEIISRKLSPVLEPLGFSPDLLPIVLVRPLSGSATTGLFAELVKNFGPDSLIARTAATIMGSTETTFYVIAVYFGSVAVKRTRHAILAGLTADLAGVIVSVILCRWVFA
jgi:spore maturation protein SpmA